MAQTKARGRPRSETTHRAVLDAAYAILDAEGYAGAAIERIAAEAGVAKQTIYRWWPGKAHLFLEVLSDRASQSVSLPDTGSLEGDLRVLLTGTFKAVSGDLRALMRALAVELLQDQAFAATMRNMFVERRRANIRALVQRAIDRGEVRKDFEAEMACDVAFGVMWYRLMFDYGPLDEQLAAKLARKISSN